MKLTTHLPLVPRLRMSGAVPLLQRACMAWTGTIVLTLHKDHIKKAECFHMLYTCPLI